MYTFIITQASIEGFNMIAIKNDKAVKTVEFRKYTDDGVDGINHAMESMTNGESYIEITFDAARKIGNDYKDYKDFEDVNPSYIGLTSRGKEIKTYSHFKNYVKKYC